MYDLILNDENIFKEDETMVRRTFGEEMNFLERIFEILEQGAVDLENSKFWDIREYILRILFRVFQICPDSLEKYKQTIIGHKLNLAKKL